MDKEILYKYAEDASGNIIHIHKAISGVNYSCAGCKGRFILKKGEIRQHHFSHYIPSSNCTSEGYLHKTFKKMLLDKIKKSLSDKSPIFIEWNCDVCKRSHGHNLLSGILDAKEEFYLGTCRPDIALLNPYGYVPIVIEVVHTHEPTESALKFYIQQKIILIRINVEAMEDIENIEWKLKSPSSVGYYSPLLCPTYRTSQQRQELQRRQLIQNMINFQTLNGLMQANDQRRYKPFRRKRR